MYPIHFHPLSQLSMSFTILGWSKVPFVLLLPRKHRQFCSHSFADQMKNEAVHFSSTQPTLRIFICSFEELASSRKYLSSSLHWFAQRAHIVHPAIAGTDNLKHRFQIIHSANSPCSYFFVRYLRPRVVTKDANTIPYFFQLLKFAHGQGLFCPQVTYTWCRYETYDELSLCYFTEGRFD